MPTSARLLRHQRSCARRAIALALLVLQGAIAASPFWEPQSEGRLRAHAEQDGARHVQLHNDATCTLCSARAQTSMPASVAEPVASPMPRIVEARRANAARSRDDTPANLSRAPPPLPA